MALPEIFDVLFMSIIRYECHNILLICVDFGSDIFIVVHPLDTKDESVDLRSTLPSSDVLRVEVLDPENPESVVFVLFHLVFRNENHICLTSCKIFRSPFPKRRPKKSAEVFFSEKCKYLTK